MGRLDERERLVAFCAAAAAVAASIAIWTPWFDRTAGLVLAGVGVIMAGLLALAARSGSRLFTCLAGVLLGFGPWGKASIVGLPFLLMAAWLLFRGKKAARSHVTERHPEPAEKPARKPAKERAKERARSADTRQGRPRANKRYTPPQRQG